MLFFEFQFQLEQFTKFAIQSIRKRLLPGIGRIVIARRDTAWAWLSMW